MVLDTSLLNTQQYKVRIEGKVEQSQERSSALKREPSGRPDNGRQLDFTTGQILESFLSQTNWYHFKDIVCNQKLFFQS